jgi:anti-sigma regulatory factor (Ser/Thr protein kinase)
VIRAILPSRLEYRDLAIRLVASACKLVPRVGDDFSNEFVSAFSEALNNVVVHGGGSASGEIEIQIEFGEDFLTIRLMDHGTSFDPRLVPAPDLDSLPESGLGAFIIRSFMDEITYTGGTPNTLSMTKRIARENLR